MEFAMQKKSESKLQLNAIRKRILSQLRFFDPEIR